MMEISAVRARRTREITGPTPHSVAIRARHSLTRPVEYLILERRKQEELRDEAEAVIKYNKQFDLKTMWERTTDKKIERNMVQRNVEGLLQQREYSLEERKDKLRRLLKSEEERYVAEMAQSQETLLERQAKMRERAKFLREKREAERVAIVEQKLDQRWRGECEELRAVLSKRHQDDVCRERGEQLRLQAEERRRKEQEEGMYVSLWERDCQAKCKREEMEATLQVERNKEMLQVLTLQSAAIEQQKEDMRKLKEKEAQLLREESALRALEEEREKEERRRRQAETKANLDRSFKLKMKRKTKEVQEELAMDMKLLEQMLQETSNEAMNNLQRKTKLREEIQLYRGYLAEAAAEEERREQELDALLTAEVEKQWAKRLAQWNKEKEARRKLMNDVMQTRRQQVQEKLKTIEEEKQAAQKEREELIANYEQHQQLEKEQQDRRRKIDLAHKDDLVLQMSYQQQMAQLGAAQTCKEREMAAMEENLYQKRLRAAIARPVLDKAHPRRLLATRK